MIILGTNSVKDTGYDVDNSLRFNRGSSDSLSDTQTSGNRRTWTFSTWVKKCTNGNGVTGAIHGLMSALTSDYDGIHFHNTDAFRVYFNGTSSGLLVTNRLFRDNSAFYHTVVAVDTTQGTASNRVKIYINGVQETSFSTETYPSQNYDTFYNVSNTARVGRVEGSFYLDGYMSEVCWIDGQQLDATSFGEFDEDSGIWKPIDVSGLTFGTNGFYLEFKQSGTGTNASGMGADTSGNTNHFAVNNLTAVDQSTDTCTNNFCTLNALNNLCTSGSGTLTEGNLKLSYSGGLFHTNATMAVNTGKWFWETKGVSNMQQGTVGARIGFVNQDNTGYANQFFDGGCIFGMYWHPTNGIYTNIGGTQTLRSSTLTYTDGDIIGIALDLTNNISYWYKNGSLSFTYDFSALATIGSSYICPALGNGSGSASPVYELNFGNPPFTISSGNTDGNGYGNFEYAVPANYYSLNSKNLAEYG